MAFHSNGGYSGDERESRSGEDRPDSDLGDKPVYLLEHLATFTVNKDAGIVYPSDGMRRLLQLEKTTGIWSQKMQLCLDDQWVLIMDYETGNVIERFPASLIQEPTAFTSNDPMEMYNNILVFIVAGGSGSRSEMHIFQSQSVSAVHLVEDLKQLRNGKRVTQHRETIPAPSIKASMTASGSNNNREQQQQFNAGVSGGYHHETDSELGGINDETSSISSDKYERDVTVLNHCFDDIEKFIARLQHAAAASRELERRRRNRKSKKKDPGEGLLTLRTRPPHEKEFIDIFAKFKLSFNLLAKLKAHIHDPNAPELVHFLFTPLALIVEASSDTYYESHLPARVINPLLTREAVNLLINCVTSKETELWRSLGDAWTMPRDQWKGHIGSYHPVFFDGWSPDYPVVDELEHATTPTNIKRRIETHHNFNSSGAADYDFDTQQPVSQNDKYNNHHHIHHVQHQGNIGGGLGTSGTSMRDFGARSDISIDSIERNGGGLGSSNNNAGTAGPLGNNSSGGGDISGNNSAIPSAIGVAGIASVATALTQTTSSHNQVQDLNTESWLDDMQAHGAKIVQVTYPRTANNDKELTVVRGEYLEILDDSRKWWKARNSRGQVAHVPHTIVSPYNYNDNGDAFNNPIYTQKYNKNIVDRQTDSVAERYTQSVDQHSTSPTSLLPAPNSADWVRNKHLEKRRSFGQDSSEDESHKQFQRHSYKSQQLQQHQSQRSNNPKTRKGSITRSNSSIDVPPPPPPPPPVIAPLSQMRTLPKSHSNTLKSTTSSNNGMQNEMQEELKQVLTMFREKRRNLDIMKTPEIYIQQTSTPKEVEQWLRAKGFSERVIKKMNGLDGNELFALKRHTLEDYCGNEEGKRLASQITIQRNVSGYKTARTSELQAILARARQKTELLINEEKK